MNEEEEVVKNTLHVEEEEATCSGSWDDTKSNGATRANGKTAVGLPGGEVSPDVMGEGNKTSSSRCVTVVPAAVAVVVVSLVGEVVRL